MPEALVKAVDSSCVVAGVPSRNSISHSAFECVDSKHSAWPRVAHGIYSCFTCVALCPRQGPREPDDVSTARSVASVPRLPKRIYSVSAVYLMRCDHHTALCTRGDGTFMHVSHCRISRGICEKLPCLAWRGCGCLRDDTIVCGCCSFFAVGRAKHSSRCFACGTFNTAA